MTTAENALRRLVSLAEELGIEPDDLDEEVYDLAQEVELGELNSLEDEDEQEDHLARREALASEINNGGLERQLGFLLGHDTEEAVEELLLAL